MAGEGAAACECGGFQYVSYIQGRSFRGAYWSWIVVMAVIVRSTHVGLLAFRRSLFCLCPPPALCRGSSKCGAEATGPRTGHSQLRSANSRFNHNSSLFLTFPWSSLVVALCFSHDERGQGEWRPRISWLCFLAPALCGYIIRVIAE